MPIVRIDRRFCGPPDSGNGGYVAGLLAKELGGSNISVSLRVPPPLGRALEVGSDGMTAWLRDGEVLIAEAERADLSIDVPAPPAIAAAKQAEFAYSGFRTHNFPGCFVCGPDRAEGDGLRIFPGRLEDGSDRVAALWDPDASLAGSDGYLQPEFIWAALDCPGYWAVASAAGIAVLGRFAVRLAEPRIAPQALIVTGWPIRSEGRKHAAGTAIHDLGGRLLAAAESIWITLRS